MKKIFLNSCMNFIKKYNKDISEERLEVIKYGFSSLYLTITKLIVVFIIAYLLGVLRLSLILCILYNIQRMPSFGLHASKSWICLLMSICLLAILPYFLNIVSIPIVIKGALGIIGIILMFKYSPADTKKKPIVSPIRRRVYQQASTLIACIYVLLSLIIQDNYISNCFIVSVLMQDIFIAPLTYKIFNMSYDNYKEYIILHPEILETY